MTDRDDWMTSPDASKRYGLPGEMICQAVMRGQVRAKLVHNQPYVHRADVNALALLLREGGCESCE